ncbi:hypothetical protein ACU4GH_31410 [Bradyrhizobium betae]
MRALAITGTAAATTSYLDVPTFAELGYKDYDVNAWCTAWWRRRNCRPTCAPGWRMPSSPRSGDPGTRQRLIDAGAYPVGSSPESFARQIGKEYERWGAVIRKAGITPQ